MATVALDARGQRVGLCGASAASSLTSRPTPTRTRIWWTDVGVHQNLTFPVHPDPVSGMHCWHQAVRVRKADPDDRLRRHLTWTRQKSRDVYRTLARS